MYIILGFKCLKWLNLNLKINTFSLDLNNEEILWLKKILLFFENLLLQKLPPEIALCHLK